MKNLVNQVYWESMLDTYMFGSNLKIANNNHVEFVNRLMPSGKIITAWHSSSNYQATKQVPKLPILTNRRRYRINIHADFNPNNSVIIRIVFFDVQGEKIKKIDFRSKTKEFVFPENAVSYDIELINSGNISISFDRLEICNSNLSKDVNKDIWIHSKMNASLYPTNLVLVLDNKRSRQVTLDKQLFYDDIPVQIVNISWQAQGRASWVLKKYLDNISPDFNLISISPKLDQLANELHQEFPSTRLGLSKDFRLMEDSQLYNNLNLNNIDWSFMANQIRRFWKEGDIRATRSN
ncbi:accessory Sec system protein Asp3 [Limosilactobacillus agrestis]|uniref:accessory Sec system protein Asp3 n=1 Tax=Limosilactobacillus agrestis TaxID=2759748 RepID=UPI001E54955A|nr:accessory Sec system protein Asp3 [Limosilactobacillus agrestis]MCD7112034.1 accessory Sec system protein Asp3 [Limosilactobacillus agrestis]MCD7119834.1 accessory Sec system protein Asp3 [Limosilactobacillus agrestis]